MKLEIKGDKPAEPVLRFYLEEDVGGITLVVEDETGDTNSLLSVFKTISDAPSVMLYRLSTGFEELFETDETDRVVVQ